MVIDETVTHTPGPWRSIERDRDGGIQIYAGPGQPIAIVRDGPDYTENATLIVAAPDLLAALELVLPLAEEYLKKAQGHPDNAKLETARGAIVKARKG